MNDVYFSNHYSSLDQDPLVQNFIKDFKEKYGKDPNAFHALGYYLGKYIADAVERAGSTDSEQIKDALANTENLLGVTVPLAWVLIITRSNQLLLLVWKMCSGFQREGRT